MTSERTVYGGGGGGASSARATAAHSTASLAVNATENAQIAMAKAYRLLRIQTNRPARLRVYTTAAKRTADAGRAVGTDPTGDHGVVLDYVTTASLLAADLSPAVDGANLEAIPTADIPIAVENRDSGAGVVTVTFTYLPEE